MSVQLDFAGDLALQVVAVLDSASINSERLQRETWLIVLPSHNIIAAVMLAELHGRIGHFPAIAKISPSTSEVMTTYDITGIINLDQVRQNARTHR